MTGGRRRPLMLLPAAGVAAVLLGATGAQGELKQNFLISSPFSTHDHRGARMVPYWDQGGSTIIKQSFVRLTPDKPDNFGYLWSRQKLNTPVFSISWKFRISGGADREHGDTMTLMVSDSKYKPGSFYGLTEEFTGIAVVVNTNRARTWGGANGERPVGNNRHRDVTLIVNDGLSKMEEILPKAQGCNANMRFYEGRDDFNVLQSSRIRILADEKSVALDIDSRNTGRWRRCVTHTIEDGTMPKEWAKSSYVGIAAKTSEVSNNHDVLSFKVYTTTEEAWERLDEGDDEDEMDTLIHHLEHELFNIHDGLQNAIDQLEAAEESAEKRLEELEESMNRNVMQALERRVSALEEDMSTNVKRTVERKISQAYNGINDRVEVKMTEHVGQMSGQWQRPFYGLLLVLVIIVGIILSKYRQLQKHHIL